MCCCESGFNNHNLVKVENAMHILSCSRFVQILCHPMRSWCVRGLTHSRCKGDAGSIFILHSTLGGASRRSESESRKKPWLVQMVKTICTVDLPKPGWSVHMQSLPDAQETMQLVEVHTRPHGHEPHWLLLCFFSVSFQSINHKMVNRMSQAFILFSLSDLPSTHTERWWVLYPNDVANTYLIHQCFLLNLRLGLWSSECFGSAWLWKGSRWLFFTWSLVTVALKLAKVLIVVPFLPLQLDTETIF